MPYTYEYPHMAAGVDVVVFKKGDVAKVLLIKRANAPYAGSWALPGGFVELSESFLEAAHRELREETGLNGLDLQFLYYFDAIGRDPRERTLSLAFWTVADETALRIRAGDDAADAKWHSLEALPELAFDHADVLARALGAWRAS